MDGTAKVFDKVMTDAQPQSCPGGVTVARDESFKDMGEYVVGDTAACVFNGHNKLVAKIVIAHKNSA